MDTVQTKDGEDGSVAMFSRSDASDAQNALNALKALSENDALFALPKSDSKTVEGIIADANAGLIVKKEKDAVGRTVYTFTMPDGKTATMSVRPFNPMRPKTRPPCMATR